MKQIIAGMTMTVATVAVAEDMRQLDAHAHGVGALDIAVDGDTVAMAFRAPGADIVGFEYVPQSAADHAAIDAALAVLAAPLEVFVLPAGAGCSVINAEAELEGEGEHDDHADHEDHADHDEHADHDDHDEHDDHADHDEPASGAGQHTEFHAEYTLRCNDPAALDMITFAYFDLFANAQAVTVQMITDTGARAYSATRAAPVLGLVD